nr:unnamed protein product [Digitaria exilis]
MTTRPSNAGAHSACHRAGLLTTGDAAMWPRASASAPSAVLDDGTSAASLVAAPVAAGEP